MKSFTDLDAWKIGLKLLEEIYELSKEFPKEEQFGITRQIRKSASSILANLAEGFGRGTRADKANRYVISRGECTEVYAFLIMVTCLKFVTKERATHAFNLCSREGRLLSGLVHTYQETQP